MVSLTNGAQIPENSILFSVTAAIDNTRTSRPLQLIQYDDTLPVVAVSLTQNSKPWIPPSGATIQVRVGKPDGHFVIADALGVDENGIVYFAVILQMTTAYGLASATLEFTDSGVKNCAPITLEITPNPVSNESIESTDDYKSLVQILQQVQGLASSAEQSQQQAAASEAAAAQSAAEAKAAAESIGIDDSTVSATKLWSSEKSVASFAPLSSALKVSGTGDGLVSLTPTVPWYFQGLRLFGKTTQDGTPSPETPVPLVSAGADEGSVAVTAAGKNLMGFEKGITVIGNKAVTIPACSGQYTVLLSQTLVSFGSTGSGQDGRAQHWYICYAQDGSILSQGSVCFMTFSQVGETLEKSSVITAPQGTCSIKLDIGPYLPYETAIKNNYTMLEFGNNPAPTYEPYKSRVVTYATPNGLPGIPVDSGGNYTDETGQQWICDEVDFEAGTYTQRCGAKTFTGADDEAWMESSQRESRFIFPIGVSKALAGNGLCSQFIYNRDPSKDKTSGYCSIDTNFNFWCNTDFSDLSAWRSHLQESPMTLVFALRTPVVSEIPAETLAAYAALQSYSSTTNILAAGCGIEATTIADAQTVITDITDRLSALEQNAIGG